MRCSTRQTTDILSIFAIQLSEQLEYFQVRPQTRGARMSPSITTWAVGIASVASTLVHGATLDDVCTTSYVAAHLPADGFYGDYALTLNPNSVTANPVTNYSVGATTSVFFPAATFDYCNVTFAYTHDGRDDAVLLTYWLPTPEKFQNRYLATGGGGYAINSGLGSLPGGVMYGAVAGQTDGGFGAFQTNAISTFLVNNGTVDWQNVFMFGYQAIREQSLLGRAFSKSFFNVTEDEKLYTCRSIWSPSPFPSHSSS